VSKILVIGPGIETRGGITSVIKAHSETTSWDKWNCVWISSYIDKSAFHKIIYFIRGYVKFLFHLPGTSLVHIHFSEPMSAYRKLFFFETARLFRIKILVHFHAFSPETTINGAHQKVYKKIFNKADSTIALSSFWKDKIADFTNSSRQINILYNPCLTIEDRKEAKSKYILFAGTLNARKGYADLIKAFSLISAKFPEWKLIFAGNGEIEKAKILARSLNIIDQVEFVGWVSGNIKDTLFRQASIFCLPSYAEGFPMAVLDAWAYGLPVITTPVGGLPDILDDGKNGLIFEPGDLNTLSQHMETLIQNIHLRSKLERESLILAEDVFHLNVIDKDLDIIYSNIIT